ncbi:metal-dependent protease of the PAD1/JA B1 superfamily [Cenarchaeum symbiosum A]|uniref:Metal-dependent protease of the PAD1/JA B1 superfamily n=1 Tax=Cenarchaeum symbiosum (strain A) TaxID=414004 RepID=A0RUZ7_CENSY|nr:metal-dependent protease of the PAD1/JA B1 superfamily [Cenarchaeum symbiosum A]
MNILVLGGNTRELLSSHAAASEPHESCALLFGDEQEDRTVVREVYPARNADESPVSFSISPEELIRGYVKAGEMGLDVVGIFHSHPSSEAAPSGKDRQYMITNPVPWLIYSGIDGSFRAYILDGDIAEIRVC